MGTYFTSDCQLSIRRSIIKSFGRHTAAANPLHLWWCTSPPVHRGFTQQPVCGHAYHVSNTGCSLPPSWRSITLPFICVPFGPAVRHCQPVLASRQTHRIGTPLRLLGSPRAGTDDCCALPKLLPPRLGACRSDVPNPCQIAHVRKPPGCFRGRICRAPQNS